MAHFLKKTEGKLSQIGKGGTREKVAREEPGHLRMEN